MNEQSRQTHYDRQNADDLIELRRMQDQERPRRVQQVQDDAPQGPRPRGPLMGLADSCVSVVGLVVAAYLAASTIAAGAAPWVVAVGIGTLVWAFQMIYRFLPVRILARTTALSLLSGAVIVGLMPHAVPALTALYRGMWSQVGDLWTVIAAAF